LNSVEKAKVFLAGCVERFAKVCREQGLFAALFGAFERRVVRVIFPKWRQPSSAAIRTGNQTAGIIAQHTEDVDIVICVHNAHDDVKNCLTSVVRHTRPPYNLIIVDDGSDAPTRDFLRAWAESQGVKLVRNEQAGGYTKAVNLGIAQGKAPFVVLLNSDTIVTPYWLDRMTACADRDGQIGLVGPLSNTASWQSVPEILGDNGDWRENPIPEKFDIAEYAKLIGTHSPRINPRVPLLNGFCMLVRRGVFSDIGTFDEESFPRGYGEENDFAIRAQKRGWTLAIADDAYVFHHQSRSYSHERRHALSAEADATLHRLHGREVIEAACLFFLESTALNFTRARIRQLPARAAATARAHQRWEGRRLLFILPVKDAGGGAHVVIQEAAAMRRMGVDARIANWSPHRDEFVKNYPDAGVPVHFVSGWDELEQIAPQFDAIVATLYSTVALMKLPALAGKIHGSYAQDFEPWFFAEGTPEHAEALASYTLLPDLRIVTKTEWNRDAIKKFTGAESTVIGPSVDVDAFYPCEDVRTFLKRPTRIAAMIRPATPRRNPEFTVNVLRDFIATAGGNIELHLFGENPEDLAYVKMTAGLPHTAHGKLTRGKMAELLGRVDIFADFSTYQAMGLTALEAMSCGAVPIVPVNGGSASFAIDEKNALIVDTTSAEACRFALKRLADDVGLRFKMRKEAIATAHAHAPEFAASRMLDALFSETLR
jgi:GT2 family glycosyltransferase